MHRLQPLFQPPTAPAAEVSAVRLVSRLLVLTDTTTTSSSSGSQGGAWKGVSSALLREPQRLELLKSLRAMYEAAEVSVEPLGHPRFLDLMVAGEPGGGGGGARGPDWGDQLHI